MLKTQIRIEIKSFEFSIVELLTCSKIGSSHNLQPFTISIGKMRTSGLAS